jgi:site-specific recombinase XerD
MRRCSNWYSARTYRVGLDKYLQWCSANGYRANERDTALAWVFALRQSNAKPASINAWLSGVRAFFRWAVDAGVVPDSPVARIRGQRRSGSSKRHSRETLTNDEMRRLLAAPDVRTPRGLRDRAILHLFAYNALRRIEICRANIEDVRTQGNRLLLDVHGKARRSADDFVVIASAAAVTALYDWLAARGKEPGPLFWSLSPATRYKRLSPRSVQYIVRNYFDAAGIFGKMKTVHSLRHTAITNAIANGAAPHKVQSMARHASIVTTMIYYHELDRIESPAEDFVSY